MIHVIQNTETLRVWIGEAPTGKKALNRLQPGSDAGLALLTSLPGGSGAAQALRSEFYDWRHRGHWFEELAWEVLNKRLPGGP